MVSRDEAFAEFAVARTGALHRSATLLCGDRHLAEDLVQETLAKVYVAWGKRGIDNPAAYAQTTLVRTFISSRRRRSANERPVESVPDTVAKPGGPDSDLRIALLGALDQLTPLDRAVLVLRFLEDQSVADTSTLLSVSPSVVRTRSRRALIRIKSLLGNDSDCLGGIR